MLLLRIVCLIVNVPEIVSAFSSVFKQNGFEVYLVGGAVRDMIRGQVVEDFDFATNAKPEEVQNLFRRVIPTGIKHGTVVVLYRGHSFEVTTYRIDGAYSDNRRPDTVHYTASLEEDLKRRDFTINALALDTLTGEVIDPHNGVSDIEAGIVRTVGDPRERFAEDALRMLRAIRFSCKLSFQIHRETLSAIPGEVFRMADVSAERIALELQRIMASATPSEAWRLIRATGMERYVLPELAVPDDLFEHLIRSADCAPPERENLRWAALLHDIGKPETETVIDGALHYPGHEEISARLAEAALRRLKLPVNLISSVSHLVAHHMFGYEQSWSDGAVRRLVSRVGSENFSDLIALRLADHCGKGNGLGMPPYLRSLVSRYERIVQSRDPLTRSDLSINGNDLITECGLSPGPKIGIVLDELLQTCMDDPAQNERETLLKIARAFIARHW